MLSSYMQYSYTYNDQSLLWSIIYIIIIIIVIIITIIIFIMVVIMVTMHKTIDVCPSCYMCIYNAKDLCIFRWTDAMMIWPSSESTTCAAPAADDDSSATVRVDFDGGDIVRL